MSYPNQPPPDSAYVVNDGEKFGSLETEAGIRSRLKNPAVLAYGKGQNNLWGSGGFLGFLTQGIFGIVGAAADFIGGILGIRNKANNADVKADTAVNTANGAAQTVVNVQKEVIQKIAVFDIRSPTPGYVAINGTEWPSIPRSQLTMQPMDVYISGHTHGENNQTTATARTDSTTIGSELVRMTRAPEGPLVATQQIFAYIRIPVDTPLTGLNFYARGTPTDLRVRLYSMAPTGDVTALTPTSPNLAGLLVATVHTATPTTFDDVLVEAGTWVAVRFSVVGTVNLAGIDMFVPEPPVGFYPRNLSSTTALASGAAAPDEIAESSMSWTTGFVPYVAVGNNIVVSAPKRSFSDNFDRADTTFGIGSNWASSLYMGVEDNMVQYISTSDATAVSMYRSPLTTDRMLTGLRLGPVKSSSAWSRFLFRCTQNRSTGLGVAFRQGSLVLESWSGSTATPLVTLARTWVTGDRIEAQSGEIVDGVEYPNRVLVFVNGIELIRTDSSVPFGPQRRYMGVGMQRVFFASESIPVDDWFGFDIPDVEPAA